MQNTEPQEFTSINRGFDATFKIGKLTLGLVVPLARYAHSPVPDITDHLARAKLAETLGFKALWLRDVPFDVPSFGDAGQLFDPFTYLGFLAGQTSEIALGVASIVLPLRHPAHVAKSAASVDVLSEGRLILGVASGDRPEEYPAMNKNFEQRGADFRASFDYIRAMQNSRPSFANSFGALQGHMDMLPRPTGTHIPMLVTGSSRQSPEWVAKNSDGWMTYPRGGIAQETILADWRAQVTQTEQAPKPVLQPLYIDLQDDPNAPAHLIHLGLSLGLNALTAYLKGLENLGVNHVALNLRFNTAEIDPTLERLARNVLPAFS